MASRLKYLLKSSKSFSYSHRRLINLHTTKKIPHLLSTAMFKCISISLTQPTHSISEDDNYNMHERNVRKLKDFDQTPTGNTQATYRRKVSRKLFNTFQWPNQQSNLLILMESQSSTGEEPVFIPTNLYYSTSWLIDISMH